MRKLAATRKESFVPWRVKTTPPPSRGREACNMLHVYVGGTVSSRIGTASESVGRRRNRQLPRRARAWRPRRRRWRGGPWRWPRRDRRACETRRETAVFRVNVRRAERSAASRGLPVAACLQTRLEAVRGEAGAGAAAARWGGMGRRTHSRESWRDREFERFLPVGHRASGCHPPNSPRSRPR